MRVHGPPSAASLARLAHITTMNDRTNDHVDVAPMNAQDPFLLTSRSSQPSAALVGVAHARA